MKYKKKIEKIFKGLEIQQYRESLPGFVEFNVRAGGGPNAFVGSKQLKSLFKLLDSDELTVHGWSDWNDCVFCGQRDIENHQNIVYILIENVKK